ncbi:MAG: VOC family protein [Rhodospirillaceae bacterium]|nr:VOC family protein [Rhodospirillaceae bacterium]
MTATLQNVILVARDLQAAQKFYVEGLGLTLKFSDGVKWTQLKAGGANVALATADEAPATATAATPVFEVADLDAATAKLSTLGAVVLQVRDMGSHGRTATLRDPDGNLIQLLQRATVRPA